MSYQPTKGMIEEAERGLAWRREFGRGGTEVGIARARDIWAAKIYLRMSQRMSHSLLGKVDKEAEGFRPGEEGYPSNGRIAWALWAVLAAMEQRDYRENKEDERFYRELSSAVKRDCKKADDHNAEHGDTPSKRTNVELYRRFFVVELVHIKLIRSVRPNVTSPEQWAYARVNSFIRIA